MNRIYQEMTNKGPKQEKLLDIIRELSNRKDITKTVVFTHWHPTLFYLSEILKDKGFKLFSIDPNSCDDKQISDITTRFSKCEGYAVLLVTDRMSEGVDLEMANSIINIDLPYNPAKLQQRIGRLDRYIQESDFIEIHNLVLKDTFEERQVDILEILNVFEAMMRYVAILQMKRNGPRYIDSKLNGVGDLQDLRE